MKPLILDDDQSKIVHEMVHTDTGGGYVLASEQGAGKTVIVAQYIVEAKPAVTLIICPLGTRVGWERTLRRQGYSGPLLRVETDSVQAIDAMLARKPGVYLMGREFFALAGSDGPIPKCKAHKKPNCALGCTLRPQRKARWSWAKLKFDTVVYDEVHAIQSRDSLGFKMAKQLKANYKIAMSGTWMGNKFEGAWAPSYWVFKNSKAVDNSFWRWAAEFAVLEFDPYTGQKVTGEKEPGRFVQTLPGYARLMANLDVDVEPEQRFVELSPTQRRMYAEMEANLVTWLGDNPMVADIPITMRARLRQITLGTPTFNDVGEVDFAINSKSSKIDALKEFIADVDDEPVLILTHSQRFCPVVVHRLGTKAVEWSGKTSSRAREEILRTFGLKSGPRYIVATIPAIGEGVDGLQQRCATEVWLSRSDNRILNEQAHKRLHRRGQTRPVRSLDIIAPNTYDEGILNGQVMEALKMNESMRRERGK